MKFDSDVIKFGLLQFNYFVTMLYSLGVENRKIRENSNSSFYVRETKKVGRHCHKETSG